MPQPNVYENNETTKLSELASAETQPLFSCKGVFPFDFLPNVVTVFRNKVSIVKRLFILNTQTTTIPIENINYVTMHYAFPLATLEISDRYFTEQPVLIKHLKRSDAEKAMKIIDGLRIAVTQNIDISKVPTDTLMNNLLRIGVVTT